MSLPQQKLSDSKAKSKFQSLPINTIYQGAANKGNSKAVPPKHGLQSLGKIPTARRAPANLPSVKSEKGGNPNVVLVPTGGTGWNKEADTKPVEKQESQSSSGTNQESRESAPKQQNRVRAPPSSGPKTWSSVTGARQTRSAKQFGHEFPSLSTDDTNSSNNNANNNGGGKPDDAENVGNQVGRLQLQSRAGKDDLIHGNGGPMLRPQSFGNWTQGGGKGVVAGQQADQDSDTKFPIPQPHKPTPPSSAMTSTSQGSANKPASNQFKAIMPHYMGSIEPPVGLSSDSQRRISRDRHPNAPPAGSRRSGEHHSYHGGGGGGGRSGAPAPRPEFAPPSIIDKEKLRRMDDLAGDDWTYDDDNFDYNKRLQSDDEEHESEHHQQTDPSWADQVEKMGSHGGQYAAYYEDKKGGSGGYEDSQEERRINKKSEEVMKNIERARKRREEEEKRYGRPGAMESQKPDENGHSGSNGNRRYDDKDPKSNDRRDWTNDDKSKGRGGQHPKGRYDDRRGGGGGRYDDRQAFDSRGGYGQQPHRYEPRKGDKEDYRTFEDMHTHPPHPHQDEEYKQQQFGRKERSYEDRNRSSEERSFSDYSHHEDNSVEAVTNQRSPAYSKHGSRHISGEIEVENGTSEWGAPRSGKTDWTEELEMAPVPEQHPSRPNSRDSRVSKDSRSSKEGKNARNSMERSSGKKLEQFVDSSKIRNQEPYINELEQDNKIEKKAPEMRNYFGDMSEDMKKVPRAAPGPITREKFDAAIHRDNTSGMTQLKKLTPGTAPPIANQSEPVKPAEPEVMQKLNPLVDSDMFETISDDDDGLLDSPEKDNNIMQGGVGGKGRGGAATRGRGNSVQDRRVGSQRGGTIGRGGMERGGGRGAPVGRGGGRGDSRGKPRSGEYQPHSFFDESEESKKNRKNLEKVGEVGNQAPAGGFMPRGQPSRRGRGDGRVVRGPNGRGGGGGRHYNDNGEEHEIGDWGDDNINKGRGGKIPPRMQRRRDDRNSRGEGDEMIDDWENESEHSNEDKRKRDSDRGGRGGRGGGRGWDTRGGGRGRGMMHGSGQMMGPGMGNDNREQTPEGEAAKKRSGIENIDLHDFAGVVVVDQENNVGGDHDGSEGGEFLQVVNKKTRVPPPMVRDEKKSYDRSGMKMNDPRGGMDKYGGGKYGGGGDKYGGGDQYGRDFNKQKQMYQFEKRKQLPPRLAKVREESRAQARVGGVSPSGVEQNGWPEGDKMGVFQVEDLGTNAWEKTTLRRDKEGSEGAEMRGSPKMGKENGGIQQTLVFENTSLKSTKDKNAIDKQGIQLPVGLGKPEDNLDVVKLDFFGGDEMGSQGKQPLSIPRSMSHMPSGQGIPPSPSTDDLTVKIANTKKLWDSPGGMVGVQENTVATSWNDGTPFTENSGFEGFQDHTSQSNDPGQGYDKSEAGAGSHHNNIQKGKQVSSMSLEQDNRPNNPMQFNRLAGNTMPAIPSPPTQLNQMGTMPQSWGYQLDRTSNMYNPYSHQSILMAGTHSIGTDLFTGSNGAGGYRLQNTGHYPGTQQSTANIISQANMISSGVKHSNQIGPIGTKAGTGASTSPYLQPGLGQLSNTFIQYDASNYNFVNPTAAAGLQRGSAPPTQTAFYQRQPQMALNAAIPGSYNHALSAQQQQQLRAANHVAGLPFMKNDLSAALSNQQKNQLGSNDFSGAANFGSAANNRSAPGNPSSPKTKLKLDHHQQQQQHQQHQQQHQQQQQQQQAGVTAASLNQLVQMRMGLGFNMSMAGVQPGYPSPIARPQMSQGGAGNHGLPNKMDYYNPEGNGEEKGEQDKTENKEGDNSNKDKAEKEQEAAVDPVQ